MRYLKYGLYGLAGILVVLLAAIAWIAFHFDPNSLKPQVEKLVLEKKQRTLKLNGDIKLSFWPRIGAEVGQVSLSEFQSPDTFARFDQVKVMLQFMPLLKQQYIVDEVRINGLQGQLIRKTDGTLSIADLLSPEKKPDEPNNPVQFKVSTVDIRNAGFRFDDQQAQRVSSISRLNFAASNIDEHQLEKLHLDTLIEHNQPKVKVQLATDLAKLAMDSSKGQFKLDGFNLSVTGEAAGIQSLALKVASQLEANTQTKQFKAGDFNLEFSGQQNGKQISASLKAPALQLANNKLEAATIEGNAGIKSAEQQIQALLKLSGISGSQNEIHLAQASLNADVVQGQQTFKVSFTSPVDAVIPTKTVSLPKIALGVDLGTPALKAGKARIDLNGKLDADATKESVSTQLTGKLDTTSLRLSANVLGFAQPAIQFDAGLGAIKVDDYIKPAATPAPAPAASKPVNIDLSGLAPLNLDGKLAMARVTQGDIVIDDIRLAVKAGKGQIAIPNLSLKAFDGSLAGNLSATTTANPRFTVNQNLTGVNLGDIVTTFVKLDKLEGRGNASINMVAQGSTIDSLKKSASGTINARVYDGALKGINIAKALREAKAKFTGGDSSVSASNTEKTDFSELTATLKMDKGIVRNDDLAAKSPLLRLAGAGQVNLNDNTLDYLIKASVVGSTKGQGGRETDDLKGLTIPVRIFGPFDKLDYKLQFGNLLSDQAKAKLDAQKAEAQAKLDSAKADAQKKLDESKAQLKDKAKQELQNNLKGLFR